MNRDYLCKPAKPRRKPTSTADAARISRNKSPKLRNPLTLGQNLAASAFADAL